MRPVARPVSFLFFAALSLSCSADDSVAPRPEFAAGPPNTGNPDCRIAPNDGKKKNSVDFLCAIEIPGNPITSSQKGWVEQQTGIYYLSDASNNGVDVIDIRTHTFIGRIPGFVGNAPSAGGTSMTNGAGPSSFTSAPSRGYGDSNRLLWVSDGNSTVRVVDPDRMQIIASVSTADPSCDGGTEGTHFCGRANEIGYDPVHHVILVSNPSPLTQTPPHVLGDGYATFISAKAPFEVLGRIFFPGAGNVEGHVWASELQRFLLPIQPTAANQAMRGTMYIAVINAATMLIEDKRIYYCPEIPGTTPTSTANNNLQLAPAGNLWGQICGRPIRMDVRSGEILNVVTQVGTGDQDWYNHGDGNFYVHGADATTGVASLGRMDAMTGAWLQNVPNPLGASPVAYARTNEIFTRVVMNAATLANPALDNSRCVVKGRGCVVVFAHVGDD